jgi:hypothetical protein
MFIIPLYNIYSTYIEIRLVAYFPRKTPEGNMTISRVNTFSYLPYAMEMNVVLYISGVIFTNLIKALNLENFE